MDGERAFDLPASVEYKGGENKLAQPGEFIPANHSQRTFESEERVAVGAGGMYEARCRKCFVPHADAPTVHSD